MATTVLRDPVHGFIRLDEFPPAACALTLRLLATPEVQRLGRIGQLGTSFVTYRGATHTRLAHALGAAWVFHRVARRLAVVGAPLGEAELLAGYAAALLHDVGHGPYSHALERAWKLPGSHERRTVEIVLGGTAVRRALAATSADLPEQVAALVDGSRRSAFPRLRPWISGQLDVDRLDYLRRDSLFAGVDYGLFDLDRLLGTISGSAGGVPVLADKGLHIAEQYLLARYHMYWQVYYHKTTRGFERLMANALARAAEVGAASGTALDALLREGATLGEYLAADDADVVVALKRWARSRDAALADLARRCLDRDLFVCVLRDDPSRRLGLVGPARDETVARALAALARLGLPPDLYLLEDTPAMASYGRYGFGAGAGATTPILIEGDGGPRPVDELSPPVAALTRDTAAVRIYVPRACAEEMGAAGPGTAPAARGAGASRR